MCGCKKCSGINGVSDYTNLAEKVGGVIVGSIAASFANKALNKIAFVKKEPLIGAGIKAAVGVALMMQDNTLVENAGLGMIAVSGLEGAKKFGIGGIGSSNQLVLPAGYTPTKQYYRSNAVLGTPKGQPMATFKPTQQTMANDGRLVIEVS